MVLYSRCNYDSSLPSCNRYGYFGSSICDECIAWLTIFSNFTNGPDGSTWWYLEITRQRRICPQTSMYTKQLCLKYEKNIINIIFLQKKHDNILFYFTGINNHLVHRISWPYIRIFFSISYGKRCQQKIQQLCSSLMVGCGKFSSQIP